MSKLFTCLFVFGTVAICAVLLFGCSGKGPTSPTEEFVPEQSVSAVTSTPTETPTAVSPAPEPGGDTVYFERTAGPGCAGTLVNPTPNAKNVIVHYTPPGIPAGQQDYFTLSFTVPGNGQTQTPSAQKAFEGNYTISKEPSCTPHTLDIEVQCDYVGAKGGHIAGRFDSVSLKQDAVFPDPVTITGEWGEYGECPQDTLTAQCQKPKCELPDMKVYKYKDYPGGFTCEDFGYETLDKDEYRPWDMVAADFYILKAGQYVRLQKNKPGRYQILVNVDRYRAISHVSACGCPDDPEPCFETVCRSRDIYSQTCDFEPVFLRTERDEPLTREVPCAD